MRYLQTGGFRNHPLMRMTLGGTLLLFVGLWITNALMYFNRMGLDPASVVRYYRGSEEEFIDPRTYGSMLEVSHIHLPMMALVALLLTHLAIFIPWPMRWRAALILATFGSALLGEASSWLVRFSSPAWAILKVGSFVTLQITLGILLAGLAVYLFGRGRPQTHYVFPVDDSPTD